MHHEQYQRFYHRISQPLRSRERLIKTLSWIEKAVVGVFVATYLFFCAFILIRRGISWRTLSLTVFLPAACFAFVSVFRRIFSRPRPYQDTGAQIQPLVEKSNEGDSFPSRHVASAFVIGTVILSQCVFGGIACYLAGLYVAFVRFLFGLHYPTDLGAGIVFGVAFGAFAFLL